MAENVETPILKARIPETVIKNYSDIHNRVRQIHELPENQRPEEYRKLLEGSPYEEGDSKTLLDEALEQVTRPHHEAPTKAEQLFEKASEKVRVEKKERVDKEPGFEGLEVIVDDNGTIKEILTYKAYPQRDEKGTRRMQENMPSGPGRLTHIPDSIGQKVRT